MAKKNKLDDFNETVSRFNRISPAANIILVIFMSLLAIVCVYPVALMIMVSFSDVQSIAEQGFSLFPKYLSLDAYVSLFEMGDGLWTAYGVTIARSTIFTVLTLIVQSLYGYVIAQRNFVFKPFYTYVLFFTMVFGAGMIPSYIVNARYLHLDDTFWILILPGLIGCSSTIILRTFINTNIPDSLMESARIDGASNLRIYIQIVIPLLKPGLACLGMMALVGRWNEWFTGILYITDNTWLTPLQTVLQRIQTEMDYMLDAMMSGSADISIQERFKNIPTESFRMAITVVATLPIMVCYPFFQKYFISGLTIGSVKG